MRIIAGKFRGTNLLTFDAENIRPTVDRVRENIFNKIQFGVTGAKVLDLFGGTGAVSLEFLSRGAESVVTCDNNPKSLNLIKKNFEKVGIKPNLKSCDYLQTLNDCKGQKFDFIFLDPPFATDYGEKALEKIAEYGLLEEDGVIIYEHLEGKEFIVPLALEIYDERKYGTVVVSFVRLK